MFLQYDLYNTLIKFKIIRYVKRSENVIHNQEKKVKKKKKKSRHVDDPDSTGVSNQDF